MDVSLNTYTNNKKLIKEGIRQHNRNSNRPFTRKSSNNFNKKANTNMNCKSGRIIIKNLHHKITKKNIKDVFVGFGKMQSYGVNYDSFKRSLCTGWVHYVKMTDAMNAKKKYNNIALDEQKMNITVMDVTVLTTKNNNGVKKQKSSTGSIRKSFKKISTLEQLDKDMDEYNAQY
ncbi:hypothetical protein A3Q56_02227 [Intoshia linei]|uniref:RRM domain-containing protein n=1 Tax=Intoshia linei TaxID=1819745 RepID=A0A177B6U8_9BILA|nr:hypothetical protein A3Q56_02227 [Intoshia linei]